MLIETTMRYDPERDAVWVCVWCGDGEDKGTEPQKWAAGGFSAHEGYSIRSQPYGTSWALLGLYADPLAPRGNLS